MRRASRTTSEASAASSSSPLVLAIPKGRILDQLVPHLRRARLDTRPLEESSRKLVRESADGAFRYLLLKPDDVPTYVEYGAADVGIIGRDVLLERAYDLYAPLDLELGKCRLVVAGRTDAAHPGRPLRVATKFPNVAAAFFRGRGEPVDIVFVQGSVELAPLTGLADVIVDLVESGETLRQNGLTVLETVCDVSSLVVVNRASMKLRQREIEALLRGLAPER